MNICCARTALGIASTERRNPRVTCRMVTRRTSTPSGPDPQGRAAAAPDVLAVEVLDVLQLEDVAAGEHLRHAEVDEGQSLHREGVLLAAILENPVTPCDADPERDRGALDRDLAIGWALGPRTASRDQQP